MSIALISIAIQLSSYEIGFGRWACDELNATLDIFHGGKVKELCDTIVVSVVSVSVLVSGGRQCKLVLLNLQHL